MDNTTNKNQTAPFVEETAALTATYLLMDAIDDVPGFVPPRVDNPTEAILIAAHALIAKLDSMETSQLEALRDLRDSVDFVMAGARGDDAELVLTARQREVIYRALEADYMEHNTPAAIEKMDADLRSFKKFAGL